MRFADVEALCFDMDGVLIQSRTVIEDAWLGAAAANGVAVTEDMIRSDIHGRPGAHTLEALFGHLPLERKKAIKTSVDAHEESADCALVPGVLGLLKRLRHAGAWIALVTSSWPKRIEFVIERHNLDWAFDTVVSRHDVARGKPDPLCYALAAERLGTVAERCLVFEDSESGVESAVRSGAACVGIGVDPALKARGAVAQCGDFTTVALHSPSGEHRMPRLTVAGLDVASIARTDGRTS